MCLSRSIECTCSWYYSTLAQLLPLPCIHTTDFWEWTNKLLQEIPWQLTWSGSAFSLPRVICFSFFSFYNWLHPRDGFSDIRGHSRMTTRMFQNSTEWQTDSLTSNETWKSFQQNLKYLQLKWVETSWWPGCAQMGDPQEMTPTRTYREPLFITRGPPESPGLWKLNLSHLRSGPWEVGVCRRQIDHQRGVPFQSSSILQSNPTLVRVVFHWDHNWYETCFKSICNVKNTTQSLPY